MRLFDAYMFIDWSATNRKQPARPRADAVWVGELTPGLEQEQETYHRTRGSALAHVTSSLLQHSSANRRVLVGFDFPYGYPAGFSRALGLPQGSGAWWTIWAELSRRIRDTSDNENNRFQTASDINMIADGRPGPFWGRPASRDDEYLRPTSPGFPFEASGSVRLQRLRIVERRLPGTQETWKLYGAGSVGSQALLGIPYVHRLRTTAELVHHSKVWPFETGFTATPAPSEGPAILHAEIWPGVIKDRTRRLLNTDPALIPDQAQVRAMCEWAALADTNGSLRKHFDSPAGLTPQEIQSCIEEEGWVLGAL
jgi:precorrin-8X/cobalt-precorrin-8 methylmutase